MQTRLNARLNTRLALIALSAAAFAAPAAAEETICTGRIGAVSLDNIFVPDGAACVLDRTRAKGSIVVGTGATLQASSVSVNGNLQAEGAAAVTVAGYSTFGGSVQLVQGGSVSISRARINGDLQFESNQGAIAANANTIGGSLQAFQNIGGAVFTNNRMKGNMQCKENVPAPTGRGNVAASKEDQCARL